MCAVQDTATMTEEVPANGKTQLDYTNAAYDDDIDGAVTDAVTDAAEVRLCVVFVCVHV